MSGENDRVVVTGTAWMGSGTGAIESALERLFREVKQEFALTVYAVSGGADLLLRWMEEALARGVEGRILVNRLAEQPADEVLVIRTLMARAAGTSDRSRQQRAAKVRGIPPSLVHGRAMHSPRRGKRVGKEDREIDPRAPHTLHISRKRPTASKRSAPFGRDGVVHARHHGVERRNRWPGCDDQTAV